MYELEDLHNTHHSQMTDPFDDNFDMIESGRSSGGNSGYKPVNMPSGSWNTGSENVYGGGSGSHYNNNNWNNNHHNSYSSSTGSNFKDTGILKHNNDNMNNWNNNHNGYKDFSMTKIDNHYQPQKADWKATPIFEVNHQYPGGFISTVGMDVSKKDSGSIGLSGIVNINDRGIDGIGFKASASIENEKNKFSGSVEKVGDYNKFSATAERKIGDGSSVFVGGSFDNNGNKEVGGGVNIKF